jgi:hypothetical protein
MKSVKFYNVYGNEKSLDYNLINAFGEDELEWAINRFGSDYDGHELGSLEDLRDAGCGIDIPQDIAIETTDGLYMFWSKDVYDKYGEWEDLEIGFKPVV